MKIDQMKKDILNFCKESFTELGPLTKKYPKSSLYRKVKRLVVDGHLEQEGSRYKTTANGLTIITNKSGPGGGGVDFSFELKEIESKIPHLKLFPALHHKLVAIAVIGAVTARQYLNVDSSHPGFAIFAPPLKWKTKLAEFIITILGDDPTTNLIYCPSETGKSLFIRRGGTGEVESVRKLLSSKFVAFDEYQKATTAVKSVIQTYLHGKKILPFENDSIEIKPVPMIMMNPLAGETVFKKLGIDEAQFRRLILCDFSNVTIPENIKEKGEEILEEIRSLKSLKLREPLSNELFSSELSGLIKKVVKGTIVEMENLRLVDFSMIMLIAKGLSGYLSDSTKAVRLALVCYLGCMQTIQFIKQDWYTEFIQFFTPNNATNNGVSKDINQVNDTSIFLPENSAFDYSHQQELLQTSLMHLGISPNNLKQLISQVKKYRGLEESLSILGLDPEIIVSRIMELYKHKKPHLSGWIESLLNNAEYSLCITAKEGKVELFLYDLISHDRVPFRLSETNQIYDTITIG